jgi:hypothetical protein
MKLFAEDESLSKILITENNGKETGELYNGQNFREGVDQEVIDGCPDCLTDSYLQDIAN